jgi:hypothetical protein
VSFLLLLSSMQVKCFSHSVITTSHHPVLCLPHSHWSPIPNSRHLQSCVFAFFLLVFSVYFSNLQI